MRLIKKGSTNISVELYIVDDTDGTPETGVVFNTSGIDLNYRRDGAAVVSITEIDLTTPILTDAHEDGGFLAVANGRYRLDIPDAAFATGVSQVTVGGTVTGMVVLPITIQLVDFDPDDAVRMGLTALPNVIVEGAGGLFTRGTGAGQINQSANGQIDVNAERLQNVAQSLLDLKDFADAGYDPVTNKVQGVVLADTVTTLTGHTVQTGDSFARIGANGAGLSDITLNAASIDLVWDEVLTGAAHNVVNSSGRRLRNLQEFQGYALGAIWIDTVDGTAGTSDFENGTVNNPVLTLADALTLAASLNLKRFVVTPGSSITFAESHTNELWVGTSWTLALGGQDCSETTISGASVSGTATAPSGDIHLEHCEMGTCTLGEAHLDECDISATITLSAAATYNIIKCLHDGSSIVDFGAAVGSTTVHIHGYEGALTINNMGQSGTDVLHFTSAGGQLTLASSCIGGTVHMHGTFNLVDNSSGMTLNNDGAVVSTLGQPAGVTIAADLVEIEGQTDDIGTAGAGLTDLGGMSTGMKAEVESEANDALVVQRLDHLVAVAESDDPVDDSIMARLADSGATADWSNYVNTTDALRALRDRGDEAWTTGAGGSDRLLMVDTTIATLSSQTSFTLTAGSTDDDAYNNCTIVIEDVSTSTQKAVGLVGDYTGSTKTVTLKYDPAIFTMAATDKIYILAENALKSTDQNRQLDVTANGAAGIDWSNVENKGSTVDLSATDIQLVDTTTTNTDMRGTDSAALASVVGALADAAVDGDPTTGDTVMQYIKQLVNVLVGTAGVVTFPSEQAPANAISLAEVIRAIHADVTGLAGSAMRGTDSAALATVLGALADSAVDGDPTTGDTVIQYIKQLVNVLVGTTGVTTFPSATAPANNVSLAEIIRAIYDDTNSLDGTKIPNTLSLANINAEVDTALTTTTYAEPAQGAPGATVSIEEKISFLYKVLRNRINQTSTTLQYFNDDATTVDHKATISDDGTTAEKGEIATGP